MKINVDTKYNVGDTIYIAESYNGEYFPSQACEIIKIHLLCFGVNFLAERVYEIKNQGFPELISESACFATYAECTKWCEEHN